MSRPVSARPASVGHVIAAVSALPADRVRFVGIDGFGGAGKSTLAAAVRDAVPDTVVVALDDLQGPGVDAWDWDALRRDVVTPLLAGEPVPLHAVDVGVRTFPAGTPTSRPGAAS